MDLKRLFLVAEEIPLAQHHEAQTADRAAYVATLLLLLEHGVELGAGVRARALAAAWARRDHELANLLLARPQWNVAAVAKALQLLDAGRQARALGRRIARLEADGRTRPKVIGALRSRLHDLQREGSVGSLSGALARHVRRWMQSVSSEKLTYYALTLPKEPWRQLADLAHANPSALAAPWFLGVSFGDAPPAGSALADCASATPEQLPSVATKHRVPYSFLRLQAKEPTAALRAAVAGYESLDTLLWYYEELRGESLDRGIAERLDAGERPGLGVGKLMERVLTLRDLKAPVWQRLVPTIDRQLSFMRLPLDAPVVVLGDASSSMTVAVRVATIIGSVLTVLTRADLRFFNQGVLYPKAAPRDTLGVLAVTDATQANGTTAPAAALWPSLDRRDLVRTFVVVTDEEENTQCRAMNFDAMLAKYRAECFPAQVVFVSFIGQRARGQMTAALELRKIPYRQLRLDPSRPDLTRLDAMLGDMAVQGDLFDERARTLAGHLAQPGTRLSDAASVIDSLLRADRD